jgi:hypothetical protein
MRDVVRTCCSLHNMIESARRNKYTGTRLMRLPEDETRPPADIRRIDKPRTREQQMEQHICLQAALLENIWQERGAEACEISER